MKFLLTLLATFFVFSIKAQNTYLLVGTYDSPKSEGIYVYSFNSKDGSAKVVSHIKTSNPSFLAISPNQKYVYAVNENADSTGKGGGVSSFAFDKKEGTLSLVSQQSSEGNHPCYISVDKTGRWILVGNYSSGNFSILPAEKKGMLGKATQVIQHEGSGPDTSRQKLPHVHSVFIKKNTTELYVPDLGIDKIMTYRLDSKTGNVVATKLKYTATDAGSGPRHIDFHPNGQYAYLMQELSSSVVVYKSFVGGQLEPIQTMSALPHTYRGPIGGGADIHVSLDGKFLYTSVRGLANSIAIFSIDEKTGMLTYVDNQYVLGDKPRNFNFDPSGKFLLVGNQNSDEIVIFKRNTETGLLTDSGNRISVGKPVCIKWIVAK